MRSVSLFTKLFLNSADFVKMTEKQDQRIFIKFCFQLGKTSSETIQIQDYFEKWNHRWNHVIQSSGDYFEGCHPPDDEE